MLGIGVAVYLVAAGSRTAGQRRLPLTADLPERALRQIEAVLADKASRSPAQRKIASQLLYADRQRRGQAVAAGVTTRRAAVEVDGEGRVAVDMRAAVTPAVLETIQAMGGTVISSGPSYRAVRAQVPIGRIEAIAELADVDFIGPIEQMITNQVRTVGTRGRANATEDPVGTNKVDTSQGDVAHRAASARAFYGVDGTGIGIGVLSDGVNSLASRQASGDLPATVTVMSGQAGSGDEGTAILEIVYDLAPGANLFFATATGGQAQFAANIEALCNAGAHVVVDDVFYLFEAVFQDGTVAQGVNNAVAAGCFHFSSAGNGGNLNDGTSGVWEGDFVAAASTPPGLGAGDAAHDFGGGNNSNQITQDTPNGFVLHWADPLGGSTNDYDLFLFDSALTTILAMSTSSQTGTQDAREFITSAGFNDLNNRLVIVRNSGAANRYLHLNTIRGRLAIGTSGQTAGHAAAANALGVAAVNVATASGGAFTGGVTNPVETYSSDGFRRIFFQPNGTAITPGNFSSTGGQLLQKPDFASADCVATSTPGFTTFCGTSAAAPHAAAIAALMLQAAGGPASLTLAQLRQKMESTALDIEAAGTDRDSGAGLAMGFPGVGASNPSMAFTDDPIVTGTTVVKTVHMMELRSRIGALRTRCGLGAFSFTDPTLTGGLTSIRAVHVAEMRTALNAAYTACGSPVPSYTDPPLTAGSTVVKTVHITELRNAVIALE